MVLNDHPEAQRVVLGSDLNLWLPASAAYSEKYYGEDGKLLYDSPLRGNFLAGYNRPPATRGAGGIRDPSRIAISGLLTLGSSYARYASGNRTSSIWMGHAELRS